jgi:2-keto-4-pentenoate hydratase
MNNKYILLAANMLFNHRLNKTGLKSLPIKCIPQNVTEAYKIQNELKILYLSLSKNICIGKKVGCTNKLAQEQINIYEPFYGNLFSRFREFSGCKLKLKNFYKPFIEPEISFRIKKDININDAPFKITECEKLFDSIVPSIEIVDFRFSENIKEVGINNLIATNGASEFWISGKKHFSINAINLENQKIKLYSNNNLVEEGNTNNVLNNPINSALWIINKLAYNGEPMLKGQYISTGTCTRAIPIISKGIIKANFGKLGTVQLNYI